MACIMERKKPTDRGAMRVSRHRQRLSAAGSRRVEVTVPSRDASLVKAVAGALRQDGDEAETIRRALQPVLAAPTARTGAELVAFLRASPLTEADLPVERDRSAGRAADFG